jgi:hypothetical protein
MRLILPRKTEPKAMCVIILAGGGPPIKVVTLDRIVPLRSALQRFALPIARPVAATKGGCPEVVRI